MGPETTCPRPGKESRKAFEGLGVCPVAVVRVREVGQPVLGVRASGECVACVWAAEA